ncbi:MAG: hypothetical protein KBS44_05020 [Clostridiales bacterium]|nr:hypothetical protein [Candidatus Coliplasma equi]
MANEPTVKDNEGGAMTVKRIKQKEPRSKKIKEFIKNFIKQFGTAVVAAAIVAYLFLQLMLNVGTSLTTESAGYITVAEREELTAFLFRNEKTIDAVAEGTDCMLVEEGQKVRRGESVAITYSDPHDVEIRKQISEIDKRLDVLERSNLSTGASTTNINVLDEDINSMILSMVRESDDGKFDKVLRDKEELLILMNRRQALIEANSYTAEINELNAEKERLSGELSGESTEVTATDSGYFYPVVDGYENFFTLDRLNHLSCEDFENLANCVPDRQLIDSSSGKIVIGSTWYIAVATTKRTAENFREGKSYDIAFQYSGNTEIKMLLKTKVTRTDKDMTVLIFSTKVIPKGFDFSRCQTVELPVASHSGIRISSSALRMKDGETGVYTVTGSKITFKKTKVLYSYGSYSICEVPVNPVYPDKTDISYSSKTELSLHDNVVLEGSDIYDGMRIK